MARNTFLYILSAVCLLPTILSVPLAATQSKSGNGSPAAPTNTAPSSSSVAATTPTLALQRLVDAAAQTALKSFTDKGFTEKNLSITVVDLRDPQHPVLAGFRGSEPIYPASVVKLFYLAAAHRWLEDKKLQETDELRRALRDMIVDSSNDATHYVVDALTDSSSGVELPPAEMAEWAKKRNAVNRFFAGLGYTGINVNQKPWCDGPFGRERIFLGPKLENRNKLTTNATARLLTQIVTARAVTLSRSTQMMNLLKRDPFAPLAAAEANPDDQARGFTGIALRPGARLWSKAGWTSTTRHDAAYIELPNGARFIVVTFTTDHSREREIIPTVARIIIAGFEKVHQ